MLRRHVRPAERIYVSGAADAHYWPGLPVLEGEGTPPPLATWAQRSPGAARLRVALRQRGICWIVDEETGAALIPGLLPRYDAWTPRALLVWRTCAARYLRRLGSVGDAAGRYTLWALGARPHRPVALGRLPGTGYR